MFLTECRKQFKKFLNAVFFFIRIEVSNSFILYSSRRVRTVIYCNKINYSKVSKDTKFWIWIFGNILLIVNFQSIGLRYRSISIRHAIYIYYALSANLAVIHRSFDTALTPLVVIIFCDTDSTRPTSLGRHTYRDPMHTHQLATNARITTGCQHRTLR